MATLLGPLNRSANTTGTTLAAKTSADTGYSCAVGDMLVLAAVFNSTSFTATVADSAGNTWVQEDLSSAGANHRMYIWTCRVASAIATNGTVTITWNSTGPSRRACQLYKIASAGGFLARNKLSRTTGSTTALSVGSIGTMGDADEYAFKFDGIQAPGAASGRTDASSGWTDKGTIDSGGTVTSVSMGSSFQALASRGNIANTATATSVSARASAIITIRGISAPADTYLQSFSTLGSAVNTTTVTPLFTPTTGNTLIAVVTTNENTGADDINTPTAWTLIGTVRNAAGTHTRMKVFGIHVADWITAGSPAMTFTTTAAQRMQVSAAEFSGEYDFTAEVTNTDEGTSNTSGTTGTVTPLGTGRLVIMALSQKNAYPLLHTGAGFQSLTVWPEDPSVVSTQKILLWVGYVDNRGASSTSSTLTWSTAAAFAGITVSLAPLSSAPAITPAAAGVSFGGTGSITAPTGVAPASTGVSFGGTGSITTPKSITPASTGVTFSGTGAVTSIPRVSGTSNVTFSGAGAITSIPSVSGTSSVTFAGTGAITSIPRVTPATGSVTFSGTGALTAATSIIPASAGVTFSGSGVLATFVVPASSGVVFSGTGAITAVATPFISGTAGVSFDGAAAITAPTRMVPNSQGKVQFNFASGGGSITAPTGITPAAAGVSFGGSGSVTTPSAAAIIPAGAGVSFAGAGSITAATFLTFTAGSVTFGGTGAVTAPTGAAIIPASSGVTFSGTGSTTAPTRVPFSATGVAFNATGSITAATRITPVVGGVLFSGTGSVTAAPRITPSSASVTFSGTGSLTATPVITPAASGVSFSGTGAVTIGPPRVIPATSGVSFTGFFSLVAFPEPPIEGGVPLPGGGGGFGAEVHPAHLQRYQPGYPERGYRGGYKSHLRKAKA